MSVYRHHGSFMARWDDEYGEEHRLAFPVETDAIQFEKKVRREVKIKKNAMKRDPASAIGKVGDLCDVWAEGQKYWYNLRVARDVKVKLGHLRLHELQPFHVKLMLNFWDEWGLADNTRTNFGHTLKRLLRYFEGLPGGPRGLDKFRVKPYQARDEMLNEAEEKKILESAKEKKPWLECWLRIFLSIGLRMTEVLNLAPCHYDLSTKSVRNLRTKGDIKRNIAVPTELQDFFDPVARKDPQSVVPFVEQIKGSPTNFRAVLWHWNDLKKKCGIPRQKRPHDLRATSISNFYDKNENNIVATQKFAGHKYMGSTNLYIRHIDDLALAPMIEKARRLRFKSPQVASIAAVKKSG
ncbi:MAG TPA: tyrosine-type recombinase/integrase [Candidatus Acidoferrum sp.]|nr:tyrosine-type recombinase/integrase [Candidatus Acidoferrum sp.]